MKNIIKLHVGKEGDAYTIYIDRTKIVSVNAVFPSKTQVRCADGHGYIVIENIGEVLRLWTE